MKRLSGAELLRAERLRQIREERFTHGHDDEHPPGVLSAAADCYMYLTHAIEAPENVHGLLWPWHPSWFKPAADPRRNLVKAGALYLAEAERYERAGVADQAERCFAFAARLARHIEEMS